MIIAILQAAAVLAATAPNATGLQSLMSRLQPMGWIYEGASDTSVVYKRGGPSAGMIWVRFEYLDPQTADHRLYRSDAQLRNYDCKAGDYQILQRTPYADNNLSGPSVALAVDDAQALASTGAIGLALQKEVCAGAH